MLTTDAKPDPPRIPIKGYTHNLDSNATEKETKERNPEPASVTPERCNVTSSEREKPLLNDAVPVADANHSTIEQEPYDAQAPTNEEKQRKKPNVGTRTKSKQKYCNYQLHSYPLECRKE